MTRKYSLVIDGDSTGYSALRVGAANHSGDGQVY